MTISTITNEIQKLAPSAIIELFELDATSIGSSIYYFHAGTNQLNADVVFNGVTYQKFPVQVEGFDFSVSGQIPRPKMRVANILGTISALVLAYQDLLGAKITRRRTFVKFLDAVNFTGSVNPTADPTAQHDPDIFYIERKVVENRNVVEFELAASFDVQGVLLPRRQMIQNSCPWVYRSAECSYTGTNYFRADDTSATLVTQDVCGKRLSSCKVRFGTYAELPFGGVPGVGLAR